MNADGKTVWCCFDAEGLLTQIFASSEDARCTLPKAYAIEAWKVLDGQHGLSDRPLKNIRVPTVTDRTRCFKTPPLTGLYRNGKLVASPMEHCTFKKGHKGKHSWEGR